MLVVIGKLTMPFIARYIDKGDPFKFDTSGKIFTSFENLLMMLMSFFNYLFVFAGLVDF